MKDYYIWFLIIFILVCSCILCYRYGYDVGYKMGSSQCPVVYPPQEVK
jgi:hypothetical protein